MGGTDVCLAVLAVLTLSVIVTRGEVGRGSEVVQQEGVRGFGEPCTCDGDCQFSKWLSCMNGTCGCLSSTFRYDFGRETCVIRLGQKCFEVGQDYKDYKELPPFIRCVPGAFCSISIGGLCACNTYAFYEEGEGCLPRKDFQSPCTASVQCQTDLCSPEGLCACRQGQYYHPTRDRCLGFRGTFCFQDEDCTDNSFCEDGMCRCGTGFEGAECQRKLVHGDHCDTFTSCNNPELSCFSGVCLCRYPDHQVYENVTGRCQSLVASAPCQGDHSCVLNADCVGITTSECQCRKGYVEMGDGTCQNFTAYGEKCERDEECDPIASLVCKDWRCECKDSLTLYDPEARVCRGLVGFRKCGSGPAVCTKNAACVQINPALPSKCTCPSPFVTSPHRTCIPIQ